MDRTEEKLKAFTDMVLKDAADKKRDILAMAEKKRQEAVEANELRLLTEAHDQIQESLRTLGRASNEEISRTILESKQALFTRRREIIDAVFSRVSARLADFRRTDAYRAYLETRLAANFQELGDEDVCVQVDEADLALVETLTQKLGKTCRVEEAEDMLEGGCLFVNQATGRMRDDSFALRLEQERQAFLERYDLRLDG